MSLKPDHNPAYWPLLLTEELYLLPRELTQPLSASEREAAAEDDHQQLLQIQAAAEVPETAAPAPQPDLLWGSLDRGILVLVEYPEHPLLDRPDGLFLVEILKALGLDFKSVATLNISRCKTSADWDWVRTLGWQHAIVFGIQHPELEYTQQAVQYQKFAHKGRTVLLAESLTEIRADQSRKKKLWNLLKQAFV